MQIEQFNKLNGYDLPIWHQFYEYCRDLVLHFNLGYSYKKNQAVSALIEDDPAEDARAGRDLDRRSR